jgi:predicted metalloprotease
VLLHNVHLIDDDELKRLAEKTERMWPTVDDDAAERITEIEAEILRLEECNEADRRRLAQEPWHLESFDEHSELTKERDGERADAEAERHQRGY